MVHFMVNIILQFKVIDGALNGEFDGDFGG